MFQYRIKVRGKTYLWGGEQASAGLFDQVYLMLRNDDLGESVKISQLSVDFNNPVVKVLGTFKRGESYTINLRTLTGVWAEVVDADRDTNIDCMIVAKP